MFVHLISSSHLLSQNDHLSIHFLLPLKVLFRPVELSKSVTLHVAIVFCGLGCILRLYLTHIIPVTSLKSGSSLFIRTVLQKILISQ